MTAVTDQPEQKAPAITAAAVEFKFADGDIRRYELDTLTQKINWWLNLERYDEATHGERLEIEARISGHGPLYPHREPQDIHSWFGLSYANYFVAPRSLLQSMPEAW